MPADPVEVPRRVKGAESLSICRPLPLFPCSMLAHIEDIALGASGVPAREDMNAFPNVDSKAIINMVSTTVPANWLNSPLADALIPWLFSSEPSIYHKETMPASTSSASATRGIIALPTLVYVAANTN